MIETAVFDTKPYDREYLTQSVAATSINWRFHEFRLSGFGSNVLGYDPSPPRDWHKVNEINLTDLDTLLRASDIVSLHLPLR